MIEAVYTCARTPDGKAYTNFQVLRRNKFMKESMRRDGITFRTVQDIIDANGNPLLGFNMNFSLPGPDAKANFREGWAKKREYVGAPLAKMSLEEQARCHEYDRNETTHGYN